MLRYIENKILIKEIPDEISLGIFISGCPNKCPECHSKYAWDGSKGIKLTENELVKLIWPNKRLISCVLFMGGEWDIDHLLSLLSTIRSKFELKTALYSGLDFDFFHGVGQPILKLLDYIKIGKYDPEKGGLDSPTTNQRLYKMMTEFRVLTNITEKFWKQP